jgi:hypothetical protein
MQMRKFIFSDRIYYSLCAPLYAAFKVVQVIPHFKLQVVQMHGYGRDKYLLSNDSRKLHYRMKYVYVKVIYGVRQKNLTIFKLK